MNDWLELVRALNKTMTAHAPGWTDHNGSDPGITTLELMAYLAEGLQYHHEIVPAGSDAASRIIRALERYKEGAVQMDAETLVAETWSGTKRPRYFSGRLLTPEDLTAEQEYHLGAHRRHLQRLHGFGVIAGMKVTLATSGDTLTVEPGAAIDWHGREIQLRELVTLGIPDKSCRRRLWLSNTRREASTRSQLGRTTGMNGAASRRVAVSCLRRIPASMG